MINWYKKTILNPDWKTINDDEFIEVLLDNWKEIPENLVEVKKNTKDRIDNIVWNWVISALFVHLLKYNLIKLPKTDWWRYWEELEVKVKKVTIKDIETHLGKSLEKDMWCTSAFEWTIADIYFTDDKKNKSWLKNVDTWKKCSLRIREKIKKVDEWWVDIPEYKQKSVYYCTIKRKLEVKQILEYKTRDWNNVDIEFRWCYEEEFEIKSPILFYKLFLLVSLYEYKSKRKDRKQLIVNNNLVLDCDKYSWIDGLIEFEAMSAEIAAFHMEMFWVIDNEKSAWWSGTLDRESDAKIIRYRNVN